MTRPIEHLTVRCGVPCLVLQAGAAWVDTMAKTDGNGNFRDSLFELESGRTCAWGVEATSRTRAQRGRPGSESAAEYALGARE
jgi:hypothetical protein